MVLCRACGRAQEIGANATRFTCRCGRAQLALRDADDGAIESRSVTSVRPGKSDELDPFCRAIGARTPSAPGRDDLIVRVSLVCDGVDCAVALAYSEGGASGVAMLATTSGLPPIKLGREGPSDVAAKARGTSREVQTGDERFDRAVYIESEASDEDVLTVLEPPAVRAAVLCLLEGTLVGMSPIELGPGGVSIAPFGDEARRYDPSVLLERLAALRVLAGAPRLRAPKVTPHPWARRSVWLAVATIPLGAASLVAAGLTYPPLSAGVLILWGIGAGITLTIVLRLALRPLLRGRSRSHWDLLAMTAAAAVGFSFLGIAGAIGGNGWIDESRERVRTGKVVATTYDREERTVRIYADGEDGLHCSFVADDPTGAVDVGDGVSVWSRAGAFGQAWRTRPARVRTSRGELEGH